MDYSFDIKYLKACLLTCKNEKDKQSIRNKISLLEKQNKKIKKYKPKKPVDTGPSAVFSIMIGE